MNWFYIGIIALIIWFVFFTLVCIRGMKNEDKNEEYYGIIGMAVPFVIVAGVIHSLFIHTP